jgi:threonine dehydratase
LISAERIEQARAAVDPVFKDTPQFVSEPLGDALGLRLLVKVECVNPIRSFKGRGADWFLQTLEDAGDLVCASAGNFGQGLAYAARRRRRRLTVFSAMNANPLKVARMRALGAEVRLDGHDFDAAKDAARHHAQAAGAIFVEDGAIAAIAEGAGTIAAELTEWPEPIDAVVVPLGNGALINGIGSWLKTRSPATRVIGVCPEGAPSMYLSWLEGRAVSTENTETIADGIAVRVPIPESVELLPTTVDEVFTISEQDIVTGMRLCFEHLGLVAEPAGSAGIAGCLARREEFTGRTVATPIAGGNLAPADVKRYVLLGQD